MKQGFVWIVGAGPGDPGLLTLAGSEALASADCVIYDLLVPKRLLDLAPAHAEKIFVGKQAGKVYLPQSTINELLIEKAKAGLNVVRLKGGDPLIFGRAAEELEALAKAEIGYAVIPGVTAAIACAATAAIPLTHRVDASAVTFVTGYDNPGKQDPVDWEMLGRFPSTLVIYMARARISEIASALIRGGRDTATPAALIESGATNRQKVHETTLLDLTNGAPEWIGTPMLAIIGPVVAHRSALHWFEKRLLFGQTVLLLRPFDEGDATARLWEEHGANVLHAPALEIQPPEDWSGVDGVIDKLADVDWLVFTSRHGVRGFLNRVLARGKDVRALGQCHIAAIGPGTADELSKYHLRTDLIPREFRSESLAEALMPAVRGKRVVLARAHRGREVLEDRLSAVAGSLERITCYRQSDVLRPSDEVLRDLRDQRIDWIIVSSTNIAKTLARWLAEADIRLEETGAKLASISPVTSAALRELGWTPSVEATRYTMEGLLEAVERERGAGG